MYNRALSEISPWMTALLEINYNWSGFKKSDTNKYLLLSTFWSILEKHPGNQTIYTDGSKTDHGVGSTFSIADKFFSWTLPHYTSIFTAELYAIWQALQYVDNTNHGNTLI